MFSKIQLKTKPILVETPNILNLKRKSLALSDKLECGIPHFTISYKGYPIVMHQANEPLILGVRMEIGEFLKVKMPHFKPYTQ